MSSASARQAMGVGGVAVVVGVMLSTIGLDRIGAATTLSAVIMLTWGLHRFGRLGPDRSRAPD